MFNQRIENLIRTQGRRSLLDLAFFNACVLAMTAAFVLFP